jgi:hypothetical protein
MLELMDKAAGLAGTAEVWLLAQPLPVQILVGAVALAVAWFLWIVLRVTLVAFRAAFRGL